MKIPLLDLKAQYETIEGQVRRAIDSVLVSQRFILGPEVSALEEELASYCGSTRAIGVSSGTDALLVAPMALVSEAAAKETLALPIYPELTREQQEHVADSVAAFFRAEH